MAGLRGELSNPLFRNAYALMLGGGLTGAVGLGYWLLAARFYDPAQVGRQSAQNQAMMFVGGLTALNFILIRFVPEMGARTGRLVVRLYLAGGAAAVTVAAGFLLTLRWWGPSFAHLSMFGPGLFFLAAVVVWSLFTAQDGTLTGLRHAPWVLAKGLVFAVVKIVLLVALAGVLPADGITVSWVLSALLLVVPIETLVHRRLIPRHAAGADAGRPIPTGAQIGRYLAGDYTGTLFYYALCNLVPVVVAAHLDARTNAFFYMAWVLAATVDVLAVNMTMSLTVEGAFDARGLAAACRSVLVRMALLLVPVTVAVLLGARLGLSVLGPGYARHGAPLLRLLVLAAVPKALIEAYIGVLRVQRRTRLVALVQGARFAGVLALVLALAHTAPVIGPGVAVLTVSVTVAAAAGPALLRVVRADGTPWSTRLSGAGSPAGPAAAVRAAGTGGVGAAIEASPDTAATTASGGGPAADGARTTDEPAGTGESTTGAPRTTADGRAAAAAETARAGGEASATIGAAHGPAAPRPAARAAAGDGAQTMERRPRAGERWETVAGAPQTAAGGRTGGAATTGTAIGEAADEAGGAVRATGDAGPRGSGRASWAVRGAWIAFAAGLGLYWIPLRQVRVDRLGGYGLVAVLPVATLAGAALLVAAFMVTLWLARPHRLLLLLQLVAIVVSLHGLAPALEPAARPPTAWQHYGFVEYIGRTGAADYALDARFSWPGFFALVAFVTRAAGIRNLEPILHWSPVALQSLYLAPLYLILRTMRANWRALWFAAWLFVVADWVGQDYFSPQGFTYLFYLLFVGALLNWFRPRPRPAPWIARTGRLRTFLRGPLAAGERPPPDAPVALRAALLLLLVVAYAATTASHQLTPFLILFACAGLVLVNRCTARGLPVLLGVIAAGWIAFMTTAYWAGHIGDLFSGAGALLANLTGGVAGRVSNGSASLATIQTGRIAIAGTVLALAVLGALRRRRRRVDDRVALVLLCAPFLAAGLQNYGGEIALRVYFFILPGACLLAAYLFFPTTFAAPRRTLAVCAAGVAALAIAGGFLFVRFGNESFEQVRPGDVRAFEAMLRQSPARMIDVVWLADPRDDAGYFPMMPWGARAMEHFDYTAVRAPANPADISGVVSALRARPGAYFVTTRGNEAYNRYNYGLPAGYAARMRTALAASPLLRPVFGDGDAVVYALRRPVGTAPPPVKARRFSFGSTSWTPIGLVALPLLIAVLAAREIVRLRTAPGQEWRLRVLTRPAVFLLIVLTIVIIERFLALGS